VRGITTEDLRLTPIAELSFSVWSRLRACALKAAFAAEESTRVLQRGSVPAAIGSARHRLGEVVAKGLRDGRAKPSPDWIREQFDQLLSAERVRLQAEWAPAQVPLVRAWRDVALAREKVTREWSSSTGVSWPDEVDMAAAPAAGEGPPPSPDPPNEGETLIEVTLKDPRRQLWGRLDRLERRGDALVIVDVKSGVGRSRKDLALLHRLQMLFYAGLVEASYGEWPRLEIAPLQGAPLAIDYSPTDVHQVRQQAVADRVSYNTAIGHGRLEVEADPLRCAWCPFQVVCPVLRRDWGSLGSGSEDRHPPYPALSLVDGVVTDVRLRDSWTDLMVEQQDPYTAPEGGVIVTRLPAGAWVRPGARLALSRLVPAGSENVIRASWNSPIWPLPSPPA
jgi:hypothetical protein